MFVTDKKIRVVGVSRGNEYSPNHVGNDAAIFRITAESLEKKGCEVILYPEKEFVKQGIEADFIFDMARDRATINRLKELDLSCKNWKTTGLRWSTRRMASTTACARR